MRDAAALVSLKRLAVAMAAEMHARGDLRAASSFTSFRSAAEILETRLKKEKHLKKEKEVDPRTARARAALRDATRADARATYGDASGGVSHSVSRAAEAVAEALCDSDAVARRVLAVPSAEEAAAAAAAGGRARGERFVAASWGLGSPDSSSASGGYVVRPGDVLAYEVKWAEAAEVDADDPVMGIMSPGDDGPASFDASKKSADADADAETRGTRTPTPPSDAFFFNRDDEFERFSGRVDRRAFVALDVETDDGSRLGDTDAVDQHGLRAHASSDLTRAMNARDERLGGELHENVFFSSRWYARRVAFPDAFVGKTLRRWLAVCERDAPARVRAGIRHVRVLGEDGEEAYVALASAGTPRIEVED